MKNQQIDIDSLHWYQLENPTSIQIAKILFENSQSAFESFLSKRKQFHADSCCVWLVAGISSYLINFPGIFDISFLEQNPIIQKVESLPPHFSTEDQMKKITLWISWFKC